MHVYHNPVLATPLYVYMRLKSTGLVCKGGINVQTACVLPLAII